MALLTRLLPTFLRSNTMALGAPANNILPELSASVGSSLFGQSIRTVIRNHFPRPSERKRVKVHGYKTRMSKPSGRRLLMQAILKGRHVICH